MKRLSSEVSEKIQSGQHLLTMASVAQEGIIAFLMTSFDFFSPVLTSTAILGCLEFHPVEILLDMNFQDFSLVLILKCSHPPSVSLI